MCLCLCFSSSFFLVSQADVNGVLVPDQPLKSVSNVDKKKVSDAKNMDFRARMLKSYGGVEPDVFKINRPKANELFEKVLEFVKESDRKGVSLRNFKDYCISYLKENSSGSHKLLSKDEFYKFCVNNSNAVHVYLCEGAHNLKSCKDFDRFLAGDFFSVIDNNNNCVHPWSVRFESKLWNDVLFLPGKKLNDDFSIDLNTGEAPFYRYLDGAIDLSKTQIIDAKDLGLILNVLFYDRPEILGLDRLKCLGLGCILLDQGKSMLDQGNSLLDYFEFFGFNEFERLNEAYKNVFDIDLEGCFERLHPDFDKLSDSEKATVADQFRSFNSYNLSGACLQFAKEMAKLKDKSYGPECDFKDKLLCVLSEPSLCAKFLGYQVLEKFYEHHDKVYYVVDPGCVVICNEVPSCDLGDLTLEQIFKKINAGELCNIG